jgi:hypothetical protein
MLHLSAELLHAIGTELLNACLPIFYYFSACQSQATYLLLVGVATYPNLSATFDAPGSNGAS